MTADSPDRILVIRLSALGDVVRTLPAVVSIHEAFPNARITWLTETLGASFVKGHPCLNDVIVFPTRVWRKLLLSPAGMVKASSHFFSCLKDLRTREYDMVVDFHGVLKSGLLCRAARAPRKIGYDSTGAKELSWMAYSETVTLPDKKLSRYTRNMKLAEHLGGSPPDVSSLIHIPENIKNELTPFLQQMERPVVCVHPGTSARAPYKRWMADRYSELCARIADELHMDVMLTWAPDELEFVREISEGSAGKAVISPRTETPVHLAFLLTRSALYVGSDTGAMHIATLCGTPVVALWGPTDPVENEPGPYSPYRVVTGGSDCSPCRHMGCVKGLCMETISVDDVLTAVKDLAPETGSSS